MTVTLTYEDTLSRVKIEATGVGGADTALVERSLNQVTWTTVRGGDAVPVVAGVVTLYDYEFTTAVLNYYRVTTARDITHVGTGAAAHASNASVTPTLPAGSAGDFIFVLAAIRNTAGQPNVPAGYTLFGNLVNMKLFVKQHTGAEANPTITFTGGVANATTSAQAAIFRNLSGAVTDVNFNYLQASQQNIPYPALTPSLAHEMILYWAWKQDDWTSVATLPGDGGTGVEIGDPSSTLGDDQGIVWDYCVQTTTTATTVSAGSFVVTGGGAAISSSVVQAFAPSLLQQTASITPTITEVWLKSITSPFLNRSFRCMPNHSDIQRGDKTGIFEILDRSYPVAVTDKRQSRSGEIELITDTTQEWEDLDFILSAGQPMFLQTPAGHPWPTMHVVIGTTSMRRPLRRMPDCNNVDYRVFRLPLREVAAPGSTVVGSTITWQGVLNSYATWQDVVTGETSWFDLMQNIGTPADVIVP